MNSIKQLKSVEMIYILPAPVKALGMPVRPSEHDLAVQQSHEDMQQIIEWERNAEKAQNTGWYTAGHVTERVVTTVAASAVFGGEQIAGAVAEKVGGGLLTRYAVTVAGDQIVDTIFDTAPEAINNYYDGMSKEEIIDNA